MRQRTANDFQQSHIHGRITSRLGRLLARKMMPEWRELCRAAVSFSARANFLSGNSWGLSPPNRRSPEHLEFPLFGASAQETLAEDIGFVRLRLS